MIVRDAGPADAPAVAAIRVASWRVTYAGIVPASILDGMDVARIEVWVRERIAQPGANAALVIEDGGSTLGYALIGPATDADAVGLVEIQALYLAPTARGRGYGTRLLAATLERLWASSAAEAILWVLTANGPARRFYERAGFSADGTARWLDFDGTPVEEIRYRRSRS